MLYFNPLTVQICQHSYKIRGFSFSNLYFKNKFRKYLLLSSTYIIKKGRLNFFLTEQLFGKKL